MQDKESGVKQRFKELSAPIREVPQQLQDRSGLVGS